MPSEFTEYVDSMKLSAAFWSEDMDTPIEDYRRIYEAVCCMSRDIEGPKQEEEKYKFILAMEYAFNEALSRAKYWLGPCGTTEYQALLHELADCKDESRQKELTEALKALKSMEMPAYDEDEFLESQGL